MSTDDMIAAFIVAIVSFAHNQFPLFFSQKRGVFACENAASCATVQQPIATQVNHSNHHFYILAFKSVQMFSFSFRWKLSLPLLKFFNEVFSLFINLHTAFAKLFLVTITAYTGTIQYSAKLENSFQWHRKMHQRKKCHLLENAFFRQAGKFQLKLTISILGYELKIILVKGFKRKIFLILLSCCINSITIFQTWSIGFFFNSISVYIMHRAKLLQISFGVICAAFCTANCIVLLTVCCWTVAALALWAISLSSLTHADNPCIVCWMCSTLALEFEALQNYREN